MAHASAGRHSLLTLSGVTSPSKADNYREPSDAGFPESATSLFFLHKGSAPASDRRGRLQLKAKIAIRLEPQVVSSSESLRGHATMTNVGQATWLPGATRVGGVNLGVHLRTSDGKPLDVDYARIHLLDQTAPGTTQNIDFKLKPPPPGEYTLNSTWSAKVLAGSR